MISATILNHQKDFKMYFTKVLAVLIFLITFVNGFAARLEPSGNVTKVIASKARDLLQEVDEAYRSSNQNCNSTARSDDEYEKLISNYLKKNFTTHDRQPDPDKLKETARNDTEGFFTKLNNKLAQTFHRNKSETNHGDRLKRCLLARDFDVKGAKVMVEAVDTEPVNMSLPNADEFENFLVKFVICLKIEKAADSHEVTAMHSTDSVTRK